MEDKSMYILMTITIPILIFAVIEFSYFAIVDSSIHAGVNAVWALILIPVCFMFRENSK